MKKLISILLLFLYLVSTTELYQLLKIPELIEHYIEHKELNPDMTLTAFLRTHYDHPVKDGDYGKDQKLPFIIHTTPLALVFIIGNIFHFELKNDQFKQVKLRRIPSKNDNFCYKGFLRTAWEPPRYLFS